LQRLVLSSVINVSDKHDATIFRVEVSEVCESSWIHMLVFQQNRGGRRDSTFFWDGKYFSPTLNPTLKLILFLLLLWIRLAIQTVWVCIEHITGLCKSKILTFFWSKTISLKRKSTLFQLKYYVSTAIFCCKLQIYIFFSFYEYFSVQETEIWKFCDNFKVSFKICVMKQFPFFCQTQNIRLNFYILIYVAASCSSRAV
jgi:hypothetical protein